MDKENKNNPEGQFTTAKQYIGEQMAESVFLKPTFDAKEDEKRMADKEWPCEHITREVADCDGDDIYGQWIYDGGSKVSRHWIWCPDCGAKRPTPPDEIELSNIFIKNSFLQGWNITLRNIEAMKSDLLQWKRGR